MRLLLDTHALLWWLNDDPKLSDDIRNLIGDPANAVLFSVVSLWEVAVKVRIGKLDIDMDAFLAVLPEQGFERIGVEDSHLEALVGLPSHHRDPFDHLLMAQAMVEQAVFVSQDANVPLYGVPFLSCAGG
ncbi:type II toxin-antitoxin system VapC family toxin [Asticcacaulis solisilvae]|uniref:type II toxin-antitoxin system VapC family toxin n=1 Tax=Asticcacaulis solisilvae TaxID=1217274 RepID=UPI003FD7AF54